MSENQEEIVDQEVHTYNNLVVEQIDSSVAVVEDVDVNVDNVAVKEVQEHQEGTRTVEDIATLQIANQHMLEKIDALVNSTVSKEFFQQKQSELESKCSSLTHELTFTKQQLQRSETNSKSHISKLLQDVKVRDDNIHKLREDIQRDKESMVLKFAQSEQKLLDLQKMLRAADFQCKEAQKERDNALSKIRLLTVEKDKQQQLADHRTVHSAQLEKEIKKLKEYVTSADVKVKWAQNKLKEEQDSHKETTKKADESSKQLHCITEELQTIKKTYGDLMTRFQESEEGRASDLDSQLKKTVEELEQQKQEKTDMNDTQQKLMKELDMARRQCKDLHGELRQLREKYKLSEAERMCQEETANRTRESLAKVTEESIRLRHTVSKFRELEENLRTNQLKLENTEKDLNDCGALLKETETELEAARAKETELLEFTQKISDRNAALQAENLTLLKEVGIERDVVAEQKIQLETSNNELGMLRHQLESMGEVQSSELGDLTQQVQNKSDLVAQLTLQVQEEQNTIKMMKRKHAADVKDLKRQLTSVKKKLDSCNDGGSNNINNQLLTVGDAASLGSRTSSSSSLTVTPQSSAHTTAPAAPSSPTYVHNSLTFNEDSSTFGNCTPDYKVVEPDRQVLIEKIVKLQRDRSKKNEKIDFLTEHVRQLTEELQKKNKLLQNYFLREESGSITPEAFDLNKESLSRKGGIMASVHTTHIADKNMTLEFSLEINKKLQALLEDSLLKNMTLKDNIATLGAEIAKLHGESGNTNR